jgi:L-cysteine S-thiosulfotransferase
MRNVKNKMLAAALGLAVLHISPLAAQGPSSALTQYRDMLSDDNPADLWVARGAELWKTPAGAKHLSLETCDLGRGRGITKGAYAALPRYFPDAKRVMDLETRLVYCMETVQGMSHEEATRQPYGDGEKRSRIEALTAYLADQSRGMKINVPLRNPQERKAYLVGEQIFYFRGGTHDFACATCHGESGKRIRLQDLPGLATAQDARKSYASWPAYRVSQGEFRTMEWRMNDCLRQQRMPNLGFTSEAANALIMYLAHNANGGVMAAPSIKR